MKSLFTLLILVNTYCFGQDLLLDEINPSLFEKSFLDYNQQTALFCGQISEAAYWDERNIALLCGQSNEKYPQYNIKYKLLDDTFKSHHNQVLLWCNKDFLIVAFRGTEPEKLMDWFTDSKYWNYQNNEDYNYKLSNMPPGHGGFRRSLTRLLIEKELIQEIKLLIKKVNPDSNIETFPIFLTGHSLGAALSQLFIVPLVYNNLNFCGAYHFAPPLAVTCEINDEMRQKFGDKVYDIVNYKDYVPRAGRNNVAHFGKFYRICDDGLLYKEEERYIKFNLKEYFTEFKLHSLNTHISLLRNKENTAELINERSKNGAGCIEMMGKIKSPCK